MSARSDMIRARYAAELKDIVTVRRYSGLGENRPWFDVNTRARVLGEPPQTDGEIIQSRYKVILLVEDLTAAQMALPLTTDETLFIAGKELSITALDDKTIKVDGVLIAYKIEAVG